MVLNNAGLLTTTNFDEITAADHTVVTGVTGKTVDVHEICVTAAGNVDLTLKSGTTVILGPIGLRDGLFHLELSKIAPIMSTAEDEAFVMTLSAAVRVSGFVKTVQS